MKRTIAIDIDGTLRDINQQILKYLEIDYPEKAALFKSNYKTVYSSLDEVFSSQEELFSWMYEQRCFEIFGMANRTHPKVIDDLNIFTKAAEDSGKYKVWIASVQRDRSIQATLHWLSKWGCRVKRYMFFDTMQDKIDHSFDIYVDDCPKVIEQTMLTAIKVEWPFTEKFEVPSLDIVNGKFDDIHDILKVERILKKE